MTALLQVDKIEPWDLEYYFSVLTNEFEQQHFDPQNGWSKTTQLAATLGYHSVDNLASVDDPQRILVRGQRRQIGQSY